MTFFANNDSFVFGADGPSIKEGVLNLKNETKTATQVVDLASRRKEKLSNRQVLGLQMAKRGLQQPVPVDQKVAEIK